MRSDYKDKIYKKKIIYRDYFKVAKNIILKKFKKNSSINILDAGCSNASFLFYLRNFLPKSNFVGIDNSKSSITLGRKIVKKYKNIDLIKSEVLKFKYSKKFDVIIVSGLLCFFDDFRPVLNHMFKILKKNKKSKIIIFGDFNPYGIDKIISFRDQRSANSKNKWNKGFTSFSIKTISEYLKKKNFKTSKLEFFPKKYIVEKNDPLRSFTIFSKNKKKFMANKAGLIFKFYFLTISKK